MNTNKKFEYSADSIRYNNKIIDIHSQKTKRTKSLVKILCGCILALSGTTIFLIGLGNHTVIGEYIRIPGMIVSFSGFISIVFFIFQDFLELGYSVGEKATYEKLLRDPKEKIDQTNNVAEPPVDYSLIAKQMEKRLTEEIEAQGRKANTNLFMGVMTALISVGILGWLSFQATNNFDSIFNNNFKNDHLDNKYIYIFYFGIFLSKITLSITSSIFSFFFLSTYRRNLGEIKFFQNELTNVQYRLVSIFMAKDLDLKIVLNELLLKNAEVERNFILKNGESTIELRSREIDVGETNALMTAVKQAGAEAIPSLKNKENTPETHEKK